MITLKTILKFYSIIIGLACIYMCLRYLTAMLFYDQVLIPSEGFVIIEIIMLILAIPYLIYMLFEGINND